MAEIKTKGNNRSLLLSIANELMLPKALKIATFKRGSTAVTKNTNNRNCSCRSGLIGSRRCGKVNASNEKKYVGMNNG